MNVFVQRVGDNMQVMIGVCSRGLIVFHYSVRLLTISWPKIIKVKYRRTRFIVKIRRLANQVKPELVKVRVNGSIYGSGLVGSGWVAGNQNFI